MKKFVLKIKLNHLIFEIYPLNTFIVIILKVGNLYNKFEDIKKLNIFS